ncbi:MAG TPA: hypothetical protein VIL74_22930 [Pyrinomonadaceae bacterium]|jgi:hypothetical protein
MKINKYLLKLAFLSFAVLLTFAATADAQKRRSTRRTTPAKTTTTATTTTSPLEVKEGANKVSIQIKNVSKFIYILGGVASGFETADKEAKANKLSRAAIDANNKDKQAVITSIRNLKAGLAELEVQFRTKPALKPYLLQIQGITDLTSQSEELAVAGKFRDSGRALLTVVEKLSDTVTAMP